MSAALSFPVAPMKATLGRLPTGDDWAYEVKWDGYRTLAHIDVDRVRLQSSAGHDVTERWPELTQIATALNASNAVLDAELVALDSDGRPRFELVQNSGVGTGREAVLYLFDVLAVDGTPTVQLPYLQRRRLLEQLVEPGPNWTMPAHRVGEAEGAALASATLAEGLEGVVAKRLESTYEVGRRSAAWVKVKHRRQMTVTIGGYTAGSGQRATTFGSLLVGVPDGERLRFVGAVGTGFSEARRRSLLDQLTPHRTDRSPFEPPPPASYAADATWVEPLQQATIEVTEITNAGFVRHASFVALSGGAER